MSKTSTETKSKGFGGFSPQALRFLRDLAKNNDRNWFAPRKTFYEQELLEPLRALVADATTALARAKIPIAADASRPVFRIYRDVRFSSDKSPYKTNLGAYLAYNGQRGAPGGLYVHVEPGRSFMAIAFYELERPALQRWREAMAGDPKRFTSVLRALERNGLQISEEHASLKRMPRGFESQAGGPLERYFRMNSFTVGDRLSDADLQQPALIARMVDLARGAKPLLTFGWSVV